MLLLKKTDSENHFIGLLAKTEKIEQHLIDNHLLPELQKFLKSNGINENLVIAKSPDGQAYICFDHKTLIPLFDSGSSGTLALTILFYWKQFLSDASFIFIDEFDAFCHTSVARALFTNLIRLKKPVVLTTNNTNLLDHRITRPDCCFQIQNGRLKSFSNLAERVIRQGNNLEKLYIAGEFDS